VSRAAEQEAKVATAIEPTSSEREGAWPGFDSWEFCSGAGCFLSEWDRRSRQAELAGGRHEAFRKDRRMSRLNLICLKAVRWSGWPLFPLVLLFLLSGYIMSARFGLSGLLDEKQALALHKLLHLPLIILLLVHTAPAVYLALQRWGWIGKARTANGD
jgi:hypothetical protein